MALIELDEERDLQRGTVDYSALMTKEQRDRGDFYSQQYFIRRAEIDAENIEEWNDLTKMYNCKRDPVPDDPDFPCSMMPILTPTVEGQVASMTESKTDFKHNSNNPAQRVFMRKFDAASSFYRRKSKYQQHMKDFMRGYEVYGNAWVTIGWEPGFSQNKYKPKGHPQIIVPELGTILVDGAIKDVKDIQYARYIIREIGNVPVRYARDEYGDKYGDAVLAGFQGTHDTENDDISYDDSTTFMLLHVWTRSNPKKNLQLIEMDANGLILRESDPDKPYFKFVDNEYPFYIVRMIPRFGQFYGIGDGAILKPLQETVNNLTDELILAARFAAQPHLFVDPSAKIAEGQVTSNPSDLIYAKDPHANVLAVAGLGVNQVVMQTIQYFYQVAQQATRFSDIMTGNQQGVSATATQINGQLSQGSVGIRDKKTDIATAMEWADMYALKLCLQYWDKGFWASFGEETSEYVDMESISQLPTAVPTRTSTIDKVLEDARAGRKPSIPDYYETVEGDLIDVDFETEVIIGEAIPKGSTEMYNILLGLAQITILNKDTQQVEPLITPARMRQAMEDILGMKLKTDAENFDSLKQVFMTQAMSQLNPVGQGGIVQNVQSSPTPENLQGTVPQMPNGDSRKVQI